MSTVKDIWTFLDKWAPFDTQEEWDHSGLQVGDMSTEVKSILIALDITDGAIETAKELGANLIITHHPILFQPIDCLMSNHFAYKLCNANITHIAAHTNMDKAKDGVNDTLCAQLKLKSVKPICDGIGRTGMLEEEMSPKEFAKYVKDTLGFPVHFHEGIKKIKKVALVSGGGGDFFETAMKESEADAYLTGEMKHHEWLMVKDETCVVAGHYATENGIVKTIANALSKKFPDVKIKVYDGSAPYITI